MAETSSPYGWLGYMFIWMLLCPFIFVMGEASYEIILFLFMSTIVINIYCALLVSDKTFLELSVLDKIGLNL